MQVNQPRLPTDAGSRIGVYYERIEDDSNDQFAFEMRFVINGAVQITPAIRIPRVDLPLYAVVDVYGSTKQVNIVQPRPTGQSYTVILLPRQAKKEGNSTGYFEYIMK